ncbi:TfoX/Sxy family DNA transformation protein [Pseudooceanicola onchidii]|uniref:TfoX/Sxy family DNA transformation protein n=1 Tax=Pseudooceanicola onchidii TaxID=2562279 RepID=UPI0010AAD0DA|nr:TfoX/Sxy family DNA transformation protein [Pseudooceanicola onchidii]
MSDPVIAIRNIGPASVDPYRRAGITTADEVRDLGPDATYARLIATGTRPHFIGYYALVMGLQGRPWNDCKGAEKDALRQRFDRIRAAGPPPEVAGLPAELARFLDAIGVRVG